MGTHQHFHNSDAHLPPGFRFHPTDEELITYYLLKKVLDSNFTGRAIAEVDLNKCEPWELPEKAKMGEKEWYFFSLRDRKYPTGLRTNRATEAGYWKATGKDREIYSSETYTLVGMKKTLVFYLGRAPKGEKTNWVMHEYRLEGKFSYLYLTPTSKDDWTICRVFQKSGSLGSSGGKKSTQSYGLNFSSEVSSPSSASLPLPLDVDAADRESYHSRHYDSATKEHVPCFSTNFNPHALLDLPKPPSSSLPAVHQPAFPDVAAFPSLRSSQDNLRLPFFLPPMPAGGEMGGYGYGYASCPAPESHQKGVASTELDCMMWRF